MRQKCLALLSHREKNIQQEFVLSEPNQHSQSFWLGLKHGFPICLGYFAVAFALGIAAKQIGMTATQSGVMSIGMVASAGEFAAITLLSAGAGVIEMIATCLVVNLRYLLMSCALSQKLDPKMALGHRFLLAQTITDELFGLAAAVDGYLKPIYAYGAFIIAAFGWTLGTVLGVLAGNILPDRVVAALGASLYGMFLAIIIPPAKKERFLGILVAVSMAASGLFAVLPLVKEISSGFRVIILTLVIAGAAAVIRPLPENSDEKPADEPTNNPNVNAPADEPMSETIAAGEEAHHE